jgi:hypothetical protein
MAENASRECHAQEQEGFRPLSDKEASRVDIDKVEDAEVFLRWMQWRFQRRSSLLLPDGGTLLQAGQALP